jgi:hypothetical protein
MGTQVSPSNLGRLVRAWVACAVVDALWAVALTLAYGRTVLALWQGVAAVPFGGAMREGGVATALVGLGVHVSVAFTWSAVFLSLYLAWAPLRRALASRTGAALVACVYGPAIWVVMSGVVIPAATHEPLAVTIRWAIQLVGHAAFVGAPIVFGVRWEPSGATRQVAA